MPAPIFRPDNKRFDEGFNGPEGILHRAVDGWMDTARYQPVDVIISKASMPWLNNVMANYNVTPKRLVRDAACIGAICVAASRIGLWVGLSPGGAEFADLTRVIGGAIPNSVMEKKNGAAKPVPGVAGVERVYVPPGVKWAIDYSQRGPNGAAYDGMNLLEAAQRVTVPQGFAPREQLVVAQAEFDYAGTLGIYNHREFGHPPHYDSYPITLADYYLAAPPPPPLPPPFGGMGPPPP